MNPAPGVSFVDKSEGNLSAAEVQRRLNSLPNLEGLFHVQHGHFRWRIERVCIIPRDDRARCFSPTFALRDSWWLLGLRPFDVRGEREGIMLSLTRHKMDPGPEKVAVSYVLGLENSRNKIWFKAEESIVFRKGDHDELQTTVLGNLKSFLTDDEEAVEYDITVLCEIYVAHLSGSRAEGSAAGMSPVDPSLSTDLVSLFRSKKITDVLIEIRNFRVGAHKCVLWARSRTLARLLEGGKCYIQLSCDISCLRCVLYYMYTGSFDYLAKNAVFGIGLYETASELSLTKLRDLLTPHRIEKRCVAVVLGFRNVCTVHHFILADLPLRSLSSPMTLDRRSGMSVRVDLHQKRDTPPGTVAIDIEVLNVYKVFYVFADVSLLNRNCDPPEDVVAELVSGSVRFVDTRMFASFTISEVDVLRSLDEDSNLVIRVVCAKYQLRYRSEQGLPVPAGGPPEPDDGSGWPEELSSDMKRLFETARLSDVQAIVEGRVMKVHRPVLAARCAFFRHLFCEKNYGPNRLEIRSASSRAFWILLAYVYCGSIGHLRDLTLDDFAELGRVSAKCGVQSLAALCAQFTSMVG